MVSLGATVNGPQVLTVEYEPVPRGFAFCLMLLAVGFLAIDKWLLAAASCALSLAYHPPTAAPVFVFVAVLCVIQHRWRELAILLAGLILIGYSVVFKPPGSEGLSLLGRIGPDLEAIQRMRASL